MLGDMTKQPLVTSLRERKAIVGYAIRCVQK